MKKYIQKKFILLILGHFGGATAALLIIFAFTKLFGDACPTYAFFKICCPFCGMTRAHISAFLLDFSSAFYYNPAFPLALPTLFLMAHERIFSQSSQKFIKITAYSLFGVIVLIYIIRVFMLGFNFFD